ncbi:hypothetical protein HI914_04960 [Erysiphe necator]|uniref:Uncharacterized protein n=1 Tax=Uncinula necator TaxID=52586 RepID=A0A0B1PCF7_UNCNE|nr:hypothetical protein HI914_04960 [Erysiphe necator]KHJ34304.1 hypothetical protein EV44_g5022 [Erysiphe necator]
MNEASHLVSELQRKLDDLDHKVWAYRREMASEFEKYTNDLLQNVAPDVAKSVTQTIAESMKKYPSMCPENAQLSSIDSPRKGSREKEDEISSDNFVSLMTVSDSKRDPYVPNEHEVDFQGLFTPSYLPLLDCTSCERRSVPPELPRIRYADKGSGGTSDFMQVDASTEVTESLSPPPEPKVIKQKRRLTDLASQSSHDSDSGASRRSALRSMSSSPKAPGNQSPRRVRFDVAGEEVLPTASPLRSENYFFTEVAPDFDSDDNIESEMIEDLGDSEPESEVPNRISSSQALRLLSRKSLEDDGTIWTTVGSTSDDSSSVTDLPLEDRQEDLPQETLTLNQITLRRPMSIIDTHLDDLFYSQNHNSVTLSQDQASTLLMTSDLTSKQASYEHDEEYPEVFNFDELSLCPKRNQKFEQPEDSDDDDEDDFLTIKSSKFKSNKTNSTNEFKSSALNIPIPSTTAPETSSLGGLEGMSKQDHPFSMPIVRPEIHARAADLGDIKTFVGSMDGRTGFDESAAINFRGFIGSPERAIVEDLRTGRPPKSLTERMLLEELVEEDLCRNKPRIPIRTDATRFPPESCFK